MVVFQLLGASRNAEFLDVERCRAGEHFDLRDTSCDQRLVGRRAGAKRAVDVLREVVDGAVAYTQVYPDVRILLVKIAKRRDDNPVGESAGHFDAQAAGRQALRVRKAAVEFLE